MKEFQYLRDMTYEYNADIGLSYASPVRGVWNIVHIGTLVPEAHQIFVCPTSCLRGVVLTTAEMGAMEKMSTITVSEDNILEGDMEEALQRGTERVIAQLPERPRAMLIFTSCIHHFLAVNYQRVYRVLRKEYPDIDFIDCYMDPIMRRKSPPVPSLWRQIHRLLPKTEKRADQVNLAGNCFVYGEFCDLNALLEKSGIKVMDVNTCKTYDEFLSMGASCAVFTFHNTARAAGKDMELRLGQKWIALNPGYDFDMIDADLRKAASVLSIAPPDGEEILRQRQLTMEEIEKTRQQLKDTPLSIDYTAVDRPLELALFLSEHGFRVETLFLDNFTESEEVFEKLKERLPDLKIYQSLGWNIRKMERGFDGKIVAVGQKSAYFHNTDYFVNIVENEGMYGYRGIRRLMQLIREADAEAKPMRQLVQVKGWGCSCG